MAQSAIAGSQAKVVDDHRLRGDPKGPSGSSSRRRMTEVFCPDSKQRNLFQIDPPRCKLLAYKACRYDSYTVIDVLVIYMRTLRAHLRDAPFLASIYPVTT